MSDPQQPKNIPFLALIYLLHFNPRVFDHLLNKGLLRSVLHVFLVALLCSFVVGMCQRNDVAEFAEEWREFLTDDIGGFGVGEDGKVFWDKPEELPYTAWVGNWRVEFETRPLDEARARRGVAEKGLWVTRDAITGWEWVEIRPFFGPTEEMLLSREIEVMFPVAWRLGPKEVRGAAEIAEFVESGRQEYQFQIVRNTFYMIGLMIGVLCCFASLFYQFSLGGRGPRFRRGLLRYMVIYLHACIPPTIVATAYECFRIPGFSFLMVFCFAFIIYHMYVMRHFRREGLLE